VAKYRHVYCEFWEDPDLVEYTPEEKYFYLYLLTNPHTTQCGIYEISIRQMAFETGYNKETVDKLLIRFKDEHNKIRYSRDTKEIAIKNWAKYNLRNSGKPIVDCVKKELDRVKDLSLIEWVGKEVSKNKLKALYDREVHGASTGRGTAGTQKEKEKEKEKENNVPYAPIVKYLNKKADRNYKSTTNKTKRLIQARWNEGFNLDDFKKVIDNKVHEWLDDEEMDQYLRPNTLFSNKFEGYLNQKNFNEKKKPDYSDIVDLG